MMKRAAIIVKSLKGGGAERAAANLSRDLSSRYSVDLLLFDSTDISYPYQGTIIDLDTKPASSRIGKALNFLKRLFKIYRIKQQNQYYVTISFMPSANLLNVLTKNKDKVIVSIRNMMSRRSRSKLQNWLISWVGRKADMTISLSDGVREDLIENYHYEPSKVMTIYNSCDPQWFISEPMPGEEVKTPIDFKNPVLFMTGRLTYQKGQWHALRAMAIVKKTIPECKLVIFGDGELRGALEEYVRKLDIENNVVFMGYVKNYHSILSKGKAFVFPSLYEGLGNVILEAIACGLPVISANCQFGPSEILAPDESISERDVYYGRYGILIPQFSDKRFDVNDLQFEKSDELLAKAIIELLLHEDLQKEYQNRANIRAREFEPDRIVNKWFELIEEI